MHLYFQQILFSIMPQECVKVFVRVRPLTEKQQNKSILKFIADLPQFIFPDLQEKQINIKDVNGDIRKNKIFCFDDIFMQNSRQEDIFDATAKSLTKQVLEGYNGTIFAYGQTGSGKTHTMMGDLKKDQEKGIIPRCFQTILQDAKANQVKDFLIMCSYIEIYNEELRDLLHINEKGKLQLRQSPEKGIFIKDLKKVSVTTLQQMLKYLKIGNQNRSTGQTLMNSQSSRSHSIFTIYVQSLEKSGQNIDKFVGSKFNLVDLAGSQRQSKTGSIGDRFIEATKINMSLTALGKVISALVEGKGTFVPYRDSKLTRLLQDSLGGNAKTVMIATISPSSYNYEETISTLKYASRAKYITNVPIINEDPKDALLKEYESEIKRLRGALNEIQKDDQPQVNQLKEENKRIAKEAEKQKKELISKIKKLEQQFISTPYELSQQYKNQRDRRQQKLTFMERNYKNLEQQVKEMKTLLTQLRKKYKNASKQIFYLENQHQKEREVIQQEFQEVNKENIIYKSVLNVLFTEKQLKNIIGLGSWETQNKFRLPTFYFKDRHTLAFPCEQSQNQSPTRVNGTKNSGRDRSLDRNQTTATSFGVKIQSNNNTAKTHGLNKRK